MMEIIRQVSPISENQTVLIPFENGTGGMVCWNDPTFFGWHVCYAVYDCPEENGEKAVYGLAGVLAQDPSGIAQIEDDFCVVPTMYCPQCKNKMEAYTDMIPDVKHNFPNEKVRYRCRLCGETHRLTEVK